MSLENAKCSPFSLLLETSVQRTPFFLGSLDRLILTFSPSLDVQALAYGTILVNIRAFERGGRSLSAQILCRLPPTILGVRRLERLGYLMMKTASVCVA